MAKELLEQTILKCDEVKDKLKSNQPEGVEDDLIAIHHNLEQLAASENQLVEKFPKELSEIARSLQVINMTVSSLKNINTNILKRITNQDLTYEP